MLQRPSAPDFSYPVHHSFGRGSFKAVAEKLVVPKLVLDQIIGTESWTEKPRGRVVSSSASDRPWVDAVTASAKPKMGGVRGELKPRSSGRARALHLRVQKAAQVQRRPGRQVLNYYYQGAKYNPLNGRRC